MGQEFSRRELLWPGAAVAAGLVLGVGLNAGAAEEPTTKKKKKGKGKRKQAEARRCVVVWSEGTAPKKVYPKDINGAIAEGLSKDLTDWEVVVANLSDPDQGLPSSLLTRRQCHWPNQ